MNFKKAQTVSNAVNEHNDCTVKAIAITCDVAYKVAHEALRKAGRKNRQGSYKHEQIAAIKALGFKLEAVKLTAKTMGKVPLDPQVQQGFHLVYTRGHVAAVVNGKVEDWTEGRRHRVLLGYKVTPDATRKQRKEMQKEIFKG